MYYFITSAHWTLTVGYISGQLSLEAEKTWLQYECERWGLKFNLECK